MSDLTALSIKLYRSRLLLAGSGGAHLLSSIAVVVCGLPVWIKVGSIIGITLVLVQFGWRYGYRRGGGFIARIELLDGRWRLITGDGAARRAELTGGFAHPAIVILNFRLENGSRRSLTLLPDSADPDALRRLRVWLRVSRDTDASDPL